MNEKTIEKMQNTRKGRHYYLSDETVFLLALQSEITGKSPSFLIEQLVRTFVTKCPISHPINSSGSDTKATKNPSGLASKKKLASSKGA